MAKKKKEYTKRTSSQYNFWRGIFQDLVCKIGYMIRFKLVYRLEVYGLENVPKDNEYIVCPNHLSTLDPPLMVSILPRHVAFMAKKELFDIPILRWWIDWLGAFAVNRESLGPSTIKTVVEIKKSKWVFGIFPQGTRGIPGEIKGVTKGFAGLAKITKCAVLPVGIIGTNDDSGATRFVMIMRSFGARELYFEDGEWKTEVGSPESIQAFQFFSDLKNKYGVVPPGAIENSFNENVNLMAMEQIGMLIAGSNSVGKIFNANPDLRGKIGSVQMPSAVTTYTPVSMLGWSLNPESKNKDLAIEFVKFMSNKENSIKWVETTGRLPVMKDAIAESEYLADPLFDGFIAGVENMVQAPNAPFYAEVKTELGRTYQKLLLDPTLDVAAEVKACGAAIQNIIDNNT